MSTYLVTKTLKLFHAKNKNKEGRIRSYRVQIKSFLLKVACALVKLQSHRMCCRYFP